MSLYSDGLHEKLRPISEFFVGFCRDRFIPFLIITDESNQQGYMIPKDHIEHLGKLVDGLTPLLEKNQVYLSVDPSHSDGILFGFTLESISCDGHWRVFKKHPGKLGGSGQKGKQKPYELTFFVKRPKHNRLKKMGLNLEARGRVAPGWKFIEGEPYCPEHSSKLIDTVESSDILDISYDNIRPYRTTGGSYFITCTSPECFKSIEIMKEDQYKFATRKHMRDQSAYPSSFGPSKTFGGRGGYTRRLRMKKRAIESTYKFWKAEKPLSTEFWVVGEKEDEYGEHASWDEILAAHKQALAGNKRFQFSKQIAKLLEDTFDGQLEKVLNEDVGLPAQDVKIATYDDLKAISDGMKAFEPSEKQALAQLVVSMDNYARLADGIGIPYSPSEPNIDKAWDDFLRRLDAFRNSAISDAAKRWSDRLFAAISSWTPEDKFEDPEDSRWKADKRIFHDEYKIALEACEPSEDERIEYIRQAPWSQYEESMVVPDQETTVDRLERDNSLMPPLGTSRKSSGMPGGTFPGLASGNFGQ